MEETRYESFLKIIDSALAQYVQGDALLVVAGAKKDLAYYYGLTHHKKNIAGNIPGNFEYRPLHELAGFLQHHFSPCVRRVIVVREFRENKPCTAHGNVCLGQGDTTLLLFGKSCNGVPSTKYPRSDGNP